MKNLLSLAFLLSAFLALNSQIVVNLGSGLDLQDNSDPFVIAAPGKPIIRSTVIETTSYVDQNGVRHTTTVEYSGDSKDPKITTSESAPGAVNDAQDRLQDMLAFSNSIFREMERVMAFGGGLGIGIGGINVGKPRFRGRNQLPAPESSVVIEMVPDAAKNESVDTANATNSSSEAQNPDLTKPVMTVETIENIETLTEDELEAKLDDVTLKASQTETVKAPRVVDSKTLDKIIILTIVLLVAALAAYFGKKYICKRGHITPQSMRAQLVDIRKRED